MLYHNRRKRALCVDLVAADGHLGCLRVQILGDSWLRSPSASESVEDGLGVEGGDEIGVPLMYWLSQSYTEFRTGLAW